jgi:hypothetical protein
VGSFTGGGAYDQETVSTAVAERHPAAAIIVPPRSTAVPSEAAETTPTQRDRHLQFIAKHGRMAWQERVRVHHSRSSRDHDRQVQAGDR